MRAAIYARFSTDLQSAASIDDQVRVCRERIEQDGHKVVQVYTDRAVSGANILPGIQSLMVDAAKGKLDLLYAEALDRISRDEELRELARTFSGLVKPMVETVDRWGLKRRYLAKHKKAVEQFYKLISHSGFVGEESAKLVERLQKNRRKMFTFLEFDDVPWNNNNAEHAVKAFVTLRRVIDGSTTEEGLRNYLVLLSLCETCKYKNIDFLDFLRSGSKDIDDFADRRWKQPLRGAH